MELLFIKLEQTSCIASNEAFYMVQTLCIAKQDQAGDRDEVETLHVHTLHMPIQGLLVDKGQLYFRVRCCKSNLKLPTVHTNMSWNNSKPFNIFPTSLFRPTMFFPISPTYLVSSTTAVSAQCLHAMMMMHWLLEVVVPGFSLGSPTACSLTLTIYPCHHPLTHRDP